MENRRIGIYDSGIGGLTALKRLRTLLPGEDFVFFADSGRLPYGGRSAQELCRIARQDMDLLAGYGVTGILAACGTISSAAHEELANYPIPAFGVVYPALEEMARWPGRGPLGVIATEASIRSGEFTDALQRRCPGREVIGLACPEFAPTIEAGHISPEDPVLRDAVARALAPLRGVKLDALLLGCTHFGIIEAAIRACLGAEIPLVSASDCGAQALCRALGDGRGEGAGSVRFLISCDPAAFDAFAGQYLEMDVHAERVPVMELETP